MLINEKTSLKTHILNLNDYYVVADFDRTITDGNSKTSWSILSNSSLVPSNYTKERNELYNKYRPIEMNETMDYEEKELLIREWFEKHISLFVKYKIKEETIDKASNDLNVMQLRKGAKDFIEMLHNNNIPLIIISAGLGNFIEIFLRNNNCLLENVYICSNKIKFNSGIATGISDNIIHSLNKNEVSLPCNIKDKLYNRKNVILLGDQISDLKMIDENKYNNVIKVCFYGINNEENIDLYKNKFDIVLTEDEDYFDLMKLLF